MNQERFSFLELPGEGGSQKPPEYVSLQEIPPAQYLNYLDLLALKPAPTLLKSVSRKLIDKHRFVPIQSQLQNMPLRLPGQLDPQYHLRWKCSGGPICYIALVPPEKPLVLQLLYNAIGQGIYALPIKPETFERFMKEKFAQIRG
ncbi:MAG: hypothetical protein ACAI44_28255 [Candidatus Sericytochromatia bacterium]